MAYGFNARRYSGARGVRRSFGRTGRSYMSGRYNGYRSRGYTRRYAPRFSRFSFGGRRFR